MTTANLTSPAASEIQRTRNLIRRSWSRSERDERRMIAAARQAWLSGLLFAQRAKAPAYVA